MRTSNITSGNSNELLHHMWNKWRIVISIYLRCIYSSDPNQDIIHKILSDPNYEYQELLQCCDPTSICLDTSGFFTLSLTDSQPNWTSNNIGPTSHRQEFAVAHYHLTKYPYFTNSHWVSRLISELERHQDYQSPTSLVQEIPWRIESDTHFLCFCIVETNTCVDRHNSTS